MRPALAISTLVSAASVLASCGHKEPRMPSSWANFDCKDRKAAYSVVGGMAGQEAGVQLDCNVQGPRILRYVMDEGGTRVEDSAAVTPGEFDDVWTRINGIGWHHLDDCPPDQGNDIPVYMFDVADDEDAKTFECDALDPPFPYNTVVDELNTLAATIRGNRGKNTMDIDDEGLE